MQYGVMPSLSQQESHLIESGYCPKPLSSLSLLSFYKPHTSTSLISAVRKPLSDSTLT